MSPVAVIELMNVLKATKDFVKLLGTATSAVKGLARAVSSSWLEIQDTAFDAARAMNMSREAAMRYNRDLIASTRQLAVQYGISAKDIANFQKGYATAIGRNIVLTKQQIEQIAVMNNLVDASTAQELVDEFDKLGVSVDTSLARLTQMQEQAKFLGLNGEKAAKALASNIKLASSYSFRNGVNDIQRMALKAQQLRMEMDSVMSAAEKFMDIEGAISTSANIQMLGGTFAQNFSNPMAAMYEAMADPAAFQDRIIKTIEGKGTYDAKTGEVTFDPVTMRMMHEMAKNLGMSVEELTRPAAAMAQNKVIDEEIARNAGLRNISEEARAAIRNLSRTNIGENGQHFVTYTDNEGNVVQKEISQLTEKELQIAQDTQLTQENMWKDVGAIKRELIKIGEDRAKGTVSFSKEMGSLKEWWKGVTAGAEDLYMSPVSNAANSYKGIFGDLLGPMRNWFKDLLGVPDRFADGGIIRAEKGASVSNEGGIVEGTSFFGDLIKLIIPFMGGYKLANVNSAESILSKTQMRGILNLLTRLGKMNVMNSIGGAFGLNGLGTMMEISKMGGIGGASTLTLNNPTVIMNGNIKGSGFDSIMGVSNAKGSDIVQSTAQIGSNGAKGAAAKTGVSTLKNIGTKLKGGFGKVSKAVPYIGTALAIGGAIAGVASSSSEYETEKLKINNRALSDLGRAEELDEAKRKRNKGIGSAFGGGAAGLAGMAIGQALIPIPGLGAVIGGAVGGLIGDVVGGGIGSLFGGNEADKYRRKHRAASAISANGGDGAVNDIVAVLKQINGRATSIDSSLKSVGIKPVSDMLPNIGVGLDSLSGLVTAVPNSGNALRVAPVERMVGGNDNMKQTPTDINLNVNGTIRLDGGTNSANLDVGKLLNDPQFKRELLDMLRKEMSMVSNGGKRRQESEWYNMTSGYMR